MAKVVITEKQIIADVKAGNVAPVYLLTGEEDYYIDVLSDFFEKDFIPEENQCFDEFVVYGGDTKIDQIVDIAKQYPTLPTSKYRLVLVKEAQNIKSWDALAKYLENPLETSVVVICYRHKKIDGRTQYYKAIKNKGVIFEKDKIRDYQLADWITNYVKEKKYTIQPQTSALIAQSLGNNLGKVVNELSKIFLVVSPQTPITNEIVEKYIGISKDYNLFELQNALATKNVLKCNQIINYFAANPKENPIQLVLPNLYSYFLKIMIFHQIPDKSQAPSVIGISPYFVKDYQVASQNYGLQKLAKVISYLKDADLKSKGINNAGTITSGEIMKELIFKILH